MTRVRLFSSLGRAAVLFALLLPACAACGEGPEAPRSAWWRSEAPPAPVLPRYKLHKSPKDSDSLSKRLVEISGLAVTADGRLLAHDDERGIVHEVSVKSGKIRKSFSLGSKGVEADFEGIAVAGDALFLVTSAGVLYETREGEDGEEVEFTRFESGLGDRCEVEGLEYEPGPENLLLVCKTTRGKKLDKSVVVFRWSLPKKALSGSPPIRISKKKIRKRIGEKDFHASGIARHPESGTWLIVAAREAAVIEVSSEGELLAADSLKSKRHSRPEGIAIAARGDGGASAYELLISDEGEGRRARLARYRMR